jgi:hypothetical protein
LVYGLSVRTEIDLFLTNDTTEDTDTLVVVRWLSPDFASLMTTSLELQTPSQSFVDTNRLAAPMRRRLSGGGLRIDYADGTGFFIDQGGSQVLVMHPSQATLEDTATYIVGPVLGMVLRLRGITAIHASTTVIDGRSIVLVGSAGAGKSTTAAAFAKLGHAILTEDIAALDDQGDSLRVQPGYPRVNLWPASVELLFGSADALPRICPQHPTWDKRYLDLSQTPYRFQKEPLPLGAIYVLNGRSDNEATPTVVPLTGPEALLTLTANTYANHLLDKQMRAQEFEALSRLVQHVPVRRVTPHADPARIWDLCRCIVDDFRSLSPAQSATQNQPAFTAYE